MSLNRRQFSALAGATMTAPVFGAFRAKPSFEISLAQWSLHRTIYGGKLDNMGFPEYTKKEFGVEAVEYVNQFFKDKAEDKPYLQELKNRCDDLGVKSLLIMCDGEGSWGMLMTPLAPERLKTITDGSPRPNSWAAIPSA